MNKTMKKINVVAAIITKDNKVFATQRGYGEFKDGWEFPGGKVEAGETNEQALAREIKEELNADINVHELLHVVEYDYPAFHLTMHCYMCTLKSEHIDLLEHEAAKWLSMDDIDSVDWLPADQLILDKIEEVLK
jgi:8-oxo-dGTP diphosphatase